MVSNLLYETSVHLFDIPTWKCPAGGYRAKTWNLENNLLVRLQILAKEKYCCIRLDASQHFKGQEKYGDCLVMNCPPSPFTAVVDSKRYFVISVKWYTGKTETVGISFFDRNDHSKCVSAIITHLKSSAKQDEIKQVVIASKDVKNDDVIWKPATSEKELQQLYQEILQRMPKLMRPMGKSCVKPVT